ncbi:MAG TPA: Maf family protein [Ilumatobacter sp.]|nr:Maf family protein [Ilumatobacter sp.]
MAPTLVLASSSPRRQELLRGLGIDFTVVPADVDESHLPDEKPTDYVERVARDKAMAVVAKLPEGAAGDVVVLAADTTVDVDGDVLGKPLDDDDARRMLRCLSGRSHQVHTAVVAWRMSGLQTATVSTDVTFVDLDDATTEWYLATGQHRDKAGAYGMQGAAGALVERIDGSPSNVIGLPLAETVALLRRCGVRLG